MENLVVFRSDDAAGTFLHFFTLGAEPGTDPGRQEPAGVWQGDDQGGSMSSFVGRDEGTKLFVVP